MREFPFPEEGEQRLGRGKNPPPLFVRILAVIGLGRKRYGLLLRRTAQTYHLGFHGTDPSDGSDVDVVGIEESETQSGRHFLRRELGIQATRKFRRQGRFR